MFKKSNRGFTLVELLVVIAIIGILAAVVLVSLTSARSKARDARRISDLRQISLALEVYYDDNIAYPSASSALSAGGYMGSVPADPQTGSDYTYDSDNCTPVNQRYVIAATLEDASHSALGSDVDGLNVCGVNCEDASGVYCIAP